MRAGACGLLAVLWTVMMSLAPAEPAGVTWGERVEVAAGGGHRGPWRMNESAYDYVDDPTVAVNEQGVVAVGWADQSRKDIFVQLFGPEGRRRLPAPVNVSRSPRVFSWLPRVLITSSDPIRVYVLWQEIVFSGGSHGGDIFFARSTDGGRSFSDPLNLSSDRAGSGKGRLTEDYWHNGSLDLAMGPEGHLYAAWTEYEGALWVSRSTDGGRRFSPPLSIAGGGAARPARGPSLAVDARGEISLAWTVGEDRAGAIRIVRSTDQARSFGEARPVAGSGGHADAPKVATDSRGSVHLVYAAPPGGPAGRYRIHYTRSLDRGRTFEAPKIVSGPHPEGGEGAAFPALGLDARDTLYVVWERLPVSGPSPLGLGFTYSRDAGLTFAPPAAIPGSAEPALGANGSQQGLLMRKLAVNRSGAIGVVNSAFKPGGASRVWLLRGQAAGP